jgi:hypothetical protein
MKAFLMYRDRDFDLQRELPPNEQALTQDLELNTLFNAMALGDEFLLEVAKTAVLTGLNDVDTILYRQNILKDCLENSSTVRDIYALAVESIERERKDYWSILSDSPSLVLDRSIRVLHMFMSMLKKLKQIADERADQFESEGFTAFFAMLSRELDDEYFAEVQGHLRELTFRNGVLISAELGKGNKGTNYILRKPNDTQENWLQQLLAPKPPTYTFRIADRDQSGARALSELKTGALTWLLMRSASPRITFSVSLKCCGPNWLFTWGV